MITFDLQLPRESFVTNKEGFQDFNHQQQVLKRIMGVLSDTAKSMTINIEKKDATTVPS